MSCKKLRYTPDSILRPRECRERKVSEEIHKMAISELIDLAEEQAGQERQMPSLIEADATERYASWAATFEIFAEDHPR